MPGLFDAVDNEDVRGGMARPETPTTAPGTPDSDVDINPESLRRPDSLRYISFGSGSSGNCSYIGNSSGGLLIDAGVDNNKVLKALQDNNIDVNKIAGILLTHDHADHVRYAYALLRHNKYWQLFCTPRCLGGLLRRHNISRRIKDYHRAVYKEFAFEAGGFTVIPFETSHDGTDNVGYHISYGSAGFVVATDMGVITERASYYMHRANYMMLEADYDDQMLRTGRYPEYLKARILGTGGHLSNDDAADFLVRHFRAEGDEAAEYSELTHVFLCHLSEDNNRPAVAVDTVRKALETLGVTVGDATGSADAAGARLQLTALPRFDSSPLYILRH